MKSFLLAASIPLALAVTSSSLAGTTRVCVPPRASIHTSRGDFTLPASGTCYAIDPTTGAHSVMSGDIGIPGPEHPLVVLRRGEIVRFSFGATPQGVIGLEVRHGARLQFDTRYRLSPYAPTWRVRGRGGVLTLSVKFPPVRTPWGESVTRDGGYVARFGVR